MGTSKTLGIIGLATGWLIPLAGVVLGIIGLSVKKDEKKRQRDIILNTISIIEGIAFWTFWFVLLMI